MRQVIKKHNLYCKIGDILSKKIFKGVFWMSWISLRISHGYPVVSRIETEVSRITREIENNFINY